MWTSTRKSLRIPSIDSSEFIEKKSEEFRYIGNSNKNSKDFWYKEESDVDSKEFRYIAHTLYLCTLTI